MAYRAEPSGARFVCLACYAHASVARGLCPECEIDLLSLDDERVRADLRAEAEKRLQKRLYGEYFKLSLLGFSLSLPVLLFFGELFFVASASAIGWACIQSYTHLRKKSVLALYAARRKRLAAELAGKPPLLTHDSTLDHDGADPELLGVDETLRWLGVKVD